MKTYIHTHIHTLTHTQDELKALIQGITFADSASSLKKCLLEINAKYKELNRPAPSASAVKAVWEKMRMNELSDTNATNKFYTIGVNPEVRSTAS